jgi:hypothetical protein
MLAVMYKFFLIYAKLFSRVFNLPFQNYLLDSNAQVRKQFKHSIYTMCTVNTKQKQCSRCNEVLAITDSEVIQCSAHKYNPRGCRGIFSGRVEITKDGTCGKCIRGQ